MSNQANSTSTKPSSFDETKLHPSLAADWRAISAAVENATFPIILSALCAGGDVNSPPSPRELTKDMAIEAAQRIVLRANEAAVQKSSPGDGANDESLSMAPPPPRRQKMPLSTTTTTISSTPVPPTSSSSALVTGEAQRIMKTFFVDDNQNTITSGLFEPNKNKVVQYIYNKVSTEDIKKTTDLITSEMKAFNERVDELNDANVDYSYEKMKDLLQRMVVDTCTVQMEVSDGPYKNFKLYSLKDNNKTKSDAKNTLQLACTLCKNTYTVKCDKNRYGSICCDAGDKHRHRCNTVEKQRELVKGKFVRFAL